MIKEEEIFSTQEFSPTMSKLNSKSYKMRQNLMLKIYKPKLRRQAKI
jgi:hypothetical protein